MLHALERMTIDRRSNTVTIRRGKARLVVEFLSPEELTFSQTNRFTASPGRAYPEGYAYPDQWHLTVSTRKKSEAVSFVVKMKVRKGD